MSRDVFVFISSPADCADERSAARLVIAELNSRQEVESQGLRLRPLLWEDLPPGLAEDGDFQKRIDRLIKRGGYGGYGIYVGIMKRRLGTPTPRYASGTVEEFEESLKRRKRLGMPAEILFYFINDGTQATSDVEAFKEKIGEYGLLYAEVSVEDFAARLQQNLFDIARSWNAWQAVIRRLWRPARNVAAAVAAVAAMVLVAVDLGARRSIEAGLQADDIGEAAEVWNARRVLMPISGWAMQQRISAAISDRAAAAPDVRAAMAVLELWKSEPVLLPGARQTLVARLADRTAQEIRADIRENRAVRGLGAWHEALRIGIWDAFPAYARQTVTSLAALRMLEALSATGTGPETWADSLVRTEQRAEIARVAGDIVAHDPELAAWPNRRTRTALLLLAGRIDQLGRIASRAAKEFDTTEHPEIAAFVASAEPAALAEWLSGTINPALPPFVVGRIVDVVDARKEAEATLRVLSLATEGQFPEPGAALLTEITLAGEGASAAATGFLRDLLRLGTEPPHLAALEMLLPHLSVGVLSTPERAALTEMLLAGGEDSMSPVVIDALSRLNTAGARAAVDEELQAHLSGKTSFGFAHREALMDHIRRRVPATTRLETARQLFERSEADRDLIESPSSLNLGISIADGVERGYLRILALDAARATETDHKALSRIVERKLAEAPTGPLAGVSSLAGASRLGDGTNQKALGVALRRLPESWSLDLLDYPPPPLVDPNWDPAWVRRQIVLAALAEAPGPAREQVAETVLRGLPEEADLASRLIDMTALIGPATAKAVARDWIQHGNGNGIAVLARLGDVGALRQHVEHIADGAAPVSDLDLLADAMGEAASGPRRALLGEIVERMPAEADRVLSLAAAEGFAAAPLDRAAEALLQDLGGGNARIGVRYLASLAPDRVWDLVTRPAFMEWMERIDPFDWVGIAQELPAPGSTTPAEAIANLAVRRVVLTGFEIGYAGEDPAAGQLAAGPDLAVASHILALLAGSDHAAPALEAMAKVRPSRVETLGSIPNPEGTARAYLTWLAAGPAAIAQLPCMPQAWLGADRLGDADPLAVRAAAALVLAQPRLALVPTCAKSSL